MKFETSINTDSALIAVLAFVLWTSLHIYIIGFGERIPQTLANLSKPPKFGKSRHYTEDFFVGRVACHHQNCLENLPLFAAVVLVNAQLGDAVPSIDREAWIYIYIRIAQGMVHWTSVRHHFVVVRFWCFLISGLLLTYMALRTAGVILPDLPEF